MKFSYTDEQDLFVEDEVQTRYREELGQNLQSMWDELIREDMLKARYKGNMPDDIWKEAFLANPDNPQEYIIKLYPEWAI